ncbi:MAG TPA: hypothetical protein DF383_09535, partial [Deltaproteobacteria bacterium]|nr:hypothetical protein [Deltaproteobacteria bacterium]
MALMKTISLGSILKVLRTISVGGFILVLTFNTAHALDLLSLDRYRVKSSGERLAPRPAEGKPVESLSRMPAAAAEAPPPEILYHQVANPEPEAMLKGPPPVYLNHEVLTEVLKKYVSKSGWVDYRGLKRDKEATEQLGAYVRDLAALNPSTLQDPQDRLAAWLNLYNAMVIQEVLKYYPIENLLKIRDYYGARRFKIGDKSWSLLEIEEEI